MANFTPDFGNYTNVKPFKYWVQTVIPLVYDESLSYMELLAKVVDYLNKVIADDNKLIDDIRYLKNYIDNFINNLDFQGAVNEYMTDNFEQIMSKFINNVVSPEYYGAVGDGVTDDTTAFIQMLSEISSQNKLALIPSNEYYINNLLISDDTYILQNNGIYTNQKLIVSKTLPAVFSEETIKSFRFNEAIVQEIGGAMQGCCYDSTRNVVWIAWVSGDTDPAYLVSYTPDFETQLQASRIEISSHFNDLTYNANIDRIITPARPETNLLYIINPDTLTHETKSVNVGGIIKRCSYDEDNNIYYISTDNDIVVLNDEFEICHTIHITDSYLKNELNINDTILRQGSTVNDGVYLELITSINSNNELTDYWLVSYNLQHQKIKKVWHKTQNEILVNEAEGLYTIGNNVYISFGAGRKITFANLTGSNFVNINSVEVLKNLKTGDNMNDFVESGGYISASSSITNSLINCPIANTSFRMYVVPNVNGRYCSQIYMLVNGNIYVRHYRYDTNEWYQDGYLKFFTNRDTISGINHEIDKDGWFQVYGSKSVETVNWTQVGSLYYSDEIVIPLPSSINNIINYSFQASTNTTALIGSVTVSNNQIKFRVIAPVDSLSSVTVRFNFLGRMTV